jgi:hypothetical protein
MVLASAGTAAMSIGPMPRIMPEPRYFSIPSVVGAVASRNEALNWTPCVRSLIQVPLACTNSPAEIIRRVTEDGDQVTLAAGFDAQHAEAVLFVVKSDALDEPG